MADISTFSCAKNNFKLNYMLGKAMYFITVGQASFKVTRKAVNEVLKQLPPKISTIEGWQRKFADGSQWVGITNIMLGIKHGLPQAYNIFDSPLNRVWVAQHFKEWEVKPEQGVITVTTTDQHPKFKVLKSLL